MIKELTKFKSQDYPSFIATIIKYLDDVKEEHYPRVGVVGIAGPVNNNVVGITVNIPHWPASDGYQIA